MNSDDELNSQRNSLSNIEEIFKCPICLSRVANAMLCPNCSKVMCAPCIKKWITEQRPQCPMCKRDLHINQLINCRFVAEVSMELDKLKTKRAEDDELCTIHRTALYYYCITCTSSICSDCALFENNHTGHKFEHLNKVYQKHVDLVKAEANIVRKRLKELTNQMKAVEINIEQVSRAKEERAMELKNAIELMQTKLETQLKAKLLHLLTQKGQLVDEIELLDGTVEHVQKQLSTYSKNVFIQKSSELVKLLQELHSKPTSQSRDPISTEFESEIVPPYNSAVFRISNYSKLRETNELIYSDNLIVHSIIWRLKVYPNGNGGAKGSYISVFLEMLRGVKETTKYEYKVEMLNHKSNMQTVVREFASEFEEGECWGYNRFFQIDLLEREGYLHDDSIVLKFSVRAPTYFQECRDLKNYISQLEHQREQAVLKQLELQQKYDTASQQLTKELRRKTRWSSSDSSLFDHLNVPKSDTHSQDILEVTKDNPTKKENSGESSTSENLPTEILETNKPEVNSWVNEGKREEELISVDVPQQPISKSESNESNKFPNLEWNDENVEFPSVHTPADSTEASVGTPVTIRSSTNSVIDSSSKHSSVDGWGLEFPEEDDLLHPNGSDFWRTLSNQFQTNSNTQSPDK